MSLPLRVVPPSAVTVVVVVARLISQSKSRHFDSQIKMNGTKFFLSCTMSDDLHGTS